MTPVTQVHSLRAFALPNGARIEIEVYEGDVNAHDGDDRNWKAADINLVHPNGYKEVLCTVDYEDEKGLRTLVYESEGEDPIFTHNTKIGGQRE